MEKVRFIFRLSNAIIIFIISVITIYSAAKLSREIIGFFSAESKAPEVSIQIDENKLKLIKDLGGFEELPPLFNEATESATSTL